MLNRLICWLMGHRFPCYYEWFDKEGYKFYGANWIVFIGSTESMSRHQQIDKSQWDFMGKCTRCGRVR